MKNNQEENIYKIDDETLREISKKLETQEPIYQGCSNEQCFCTGKCREVIGYKNKVTGEIIYEN